MSNPAKSCEDPSLSEWVDDTADLFEAAWRDLSPPPISSFLGDAAGAQRLMLLGELVKVDIAYRARLGEKRHVTDYLNEFPELQEHGAGRPSARPESTPADQVSEGTIADPSAPAEAAPRIPGLEILGELGRGGMGVVYKARQIGLNRIVALKVISTAAHARALARARFGVEARAAACLQHPNIVQIYEVGNHDGRPYLLLEYVEGQSLALQLAGNAQPPRQAARLLETLARAIHFAHMQGVIHRDLKPANILMSAASSSAGHDTGSGPQARQSAQLSLFAIPKIADFGLAKHWTSGTTPASAEVPADHTGLQTIAGEILGTPSYMSPEQAEGRLEAVGPAIDIYALGAILYEVLIGRPPFKGETTLDTLDQLRMQEPIAPSRLQPRVPRDLESICLQCLQKDPRQRYASAAELADDLRRFLDGKPVEARLAGPGERLWRWCRRNPVVASLTACAALLLIAATIAAAAAAAAAAEKAAMAEKAAEAALGREAEARDREMAQKRESQMQQVQLLLMGTRSVGWSTEAWNKVTEASTIRRDGLLQSFATAALADVDCRQIKYFREQPASSVAFDSTGTRLLLGGTIDREGRPLGAARLWNSKTDELVHSTQLGSGPVAFTRDGRPLQVVTQPGVGLLIWDVASQKAVSQCKIDAKADARVISLADAELVLALSPDAAMVGACARAAPNASGNEKSKLSGPDGILAVWETATGRLIFQRPADARALAFSPDLSLLAAGNEGGQVTIYPMQESKPVKSFSTADMPIHCLAFSPNGNHLAVGSAGGTLTVWNLRTGHLMSQCHGSLWNVFCVAFSPDGMTLASAGRVGAKLWDVSTGRLLLNMTYYGCDYMTGLAFSPDGRQLAASSRTVQVPGEVVVWSLENGRGIQTLRGLTGRVGKLCFSPNGQLVAALSHDWQMAIWELENGRLRGVLDVPKGFAADNSALAFSPDGQRVAFATHREARLWDMQTLKEVQRWELPPGLQDTLAFHKSGKLLLIRYETRDMKRPPLSDSRPSDHPRVCRVRDLLSASPLKPIADDIPSFNWHVHAIASPESGDYFVVDGVTGTAERKTRSLAVYDSITAKELWKSSFSEPSGTGQPLLDPAGTVLSYHQDGNSRVLVEMPSGRLIGSAHAVRSLSPGARYLISYRAPSHPGEPSSWSLLQRGQSGPLAQILLSDQGAESPLFNSAGNRLAWGNPDGSVSICSLQKVRERLTKANLGW